MASSIFNYETKHGVAESSLLKATQVGHHYNLVNTTTDIDNGSLAKIGNYIAADKWQAAVPAVGDKVVLILTAPKIYEEYTKRMQEECNFYNAKGEVMRAYELQDTDRFTVTAECFGEDAVPAVDSYVYVDGTTFKMTANATQPSMTTYGFVGKIYEKTTDGKYRIFVMKNEQVYTED